MVPELTGEHYRIIEIMGLGPGDYTTSVVEAIRRLRAGTDCILLGSHEEKGTGPTISSRLKTARDKLGVVCHTLGNACAYKAYTVS